MWKKAVLYKLKEYFLTLFRNLETIDGKIVYEKLLYSRMFVYMRTRSLIFNISLILVHMYKKIRKPPFLTVRQQSYEPSKGKTKP